MPQTIAQIFAGNMEVMRKDLPILYEMAIKNTGYAMISKASDKHKISKTPNGQDFRAPFETMPPGKFGTFSLDGGSLGVGSGTESQQFFQTYFPMRLAIDIGAGSIYTTESNAQAVVSQWSNNMEKAIPNFKRYLDASWFSLGTGAQGLVALATGFAAGTFTFDPEYGANLLQVGQEVEIFSNDLLTHRTSAVPSNLPFIDRIDRNANTAHITNLGAITPGATDYLAFPGVTSTPTWLNGLNYFHTPSSSGSMLGVSRTNFPEIMSNWVDGAGAPLVPAHGGILNVKIRQRRGTMTANVKGLIHPAQAHQIYLSGIAISEWQRGNSDSMIDIMPKISDDFITFAGVSHLKSIHQSRKRIDWINTDKWFRVYLRELDFFETPDGRKIFEGRNATGNVTANFQYFLWTAENFGNVDPGSEAFVYNLQIPPGL